MNNSTRKAYLVGGGIGSLSAAFYLIKEAGFTGKNITVIEALPILGGSNDGNGTKKEGFVCRGGRELSLYHYENFWDLLKNIPSLDVPNISLYDEVIAFNKVNRTHSNARLIENGAKIRHAHDMGFNFQDREELMKLFLKDEKDIEDGTIESWFNPHFFTTNFWWYWQTMFAFQRWSSLIEMKRYLHRFVNLFEGLDTLEILSRTPYNQYESVILPLKAELDKYGVQYIVNTTVTDIEFKDGEGITVTAIVYRAADGSEQRIELAENDICIFTNGCITDNSNLGDYKTPAKYLPDNPPSFMLWEKLANKKPGKLGNPEPFCGNPDQTKWHSFTATFQGNQMLKLIEDYSKNRPGTGALMTFVDSGWGMSIVVAAQPHFKAQGSDTTIFWGYGLYQDNVGNFVKKKMIDCTGEEILTELIHHLNFTEHEQEIKDSVINVIPSCMPYVDALFQPRKVADRPPVIPEGSTNFALIGQFVEIPLDCIFTEEYSVRGAKTAVYGLCGIDKEPLPVTRYDKEASSLLKAVYTAMRN